MTGPLLGWVLLVTLVTHTLQGPVVGGEPAKEDVDEEIAVEEGVASLGRERRSGLGHYTNEWAVLVPGGERQVREVADTLGFKFHGQIGSIDDYYRLSREDHPTRARRSAERHTRSLHSDDRVVLAIQQREQFRYKRDFIDKRDEKAYKTLKFNDPYFDQQWYLQDIRQGSDLKDLPKMDLHVLPVWAKNITGRGVNVVILDDGIEHNHTDLARNYDPEISYDLNDKDDDPFPRYDASNENKHGTRCAGEVAMVENNGVCGVGLAFNAKIGGIRMLDGTVTDSLEAEAISFSVGGEGKQIDIMSASWGPNDDGKTVEGPGHLATKAFEIGITKGRGGKGIIYVWASGNGGSKGDNCDCDGYTGNIYTLSISSASQDRTSPWYAEKCASTMATTYSSGTVNEKKIISTDLHDKCTTAHTGTSASAPLAAGIIALLLEANPALTWRDVQHLVAWTSKPDPLWDNKGWRTNGAGYLVNTRFGFGLLDATALVNEAMDDYVTVPEKAICVIDSDRTDGMGLPKTLSNGNEIVISINTTGCAGQDNEVNFLEHVQLSLDMAYSHRGNLEIYLQSPSSSQRTPLLSHRTYDSSQAGFNDWPFMSVHSWGENPRGQWVVTIMDDMKDNPNSGQVKAIRLFLHGTKDMPAHVEKAGGSRKYSGKYNNVQNTRDSQSTVVKDGSSQDKLTTKINQLKEYLEPPASSTNTDVVDSPKSTNQKDTNSHTDHASSEEEMQPENIEEIYGVEEPMGEAPNPVVDPNPLDYLELYSDLWENGQMLGKGGQSVMDRDDGQIQPPKSMEEMIVSKETFNKMLAEQNHESSRDYADEARDHQAAVLSQLQSAEHFSSSSSSSSSNERNEFDLKPYRQPNYDDERTFSREYMPFDTASILDEPLNNVIIDAEQYPQAGYLNEYWPGGGDTLDDNSIRDNLLQQYQIYRDYPKKLKAQDPVKGKILKRYHQTV